MLKAMKLLVLYRPNSEHARKVEEYLHDFERQGGRGDAKTETLDLNTREGSAMAAVYDIVRYPGLLVTTDDGMVLHSWQGDDLPLMSEVASYLRS